MDGAFEYNQSVMSNQPRVIGRDQKAEAVAESDVGDASSLEIPSSPSCVSQTSSISSACSSVPKLIEESPQAACHMFQNELTENLRLALSIDTTEKPVMLPSSLRRGKYSPYNSRHVTNFPQQKHSTERRVRGLWNPNCKCLFSGLHDDILLYIFSHLSLKDTLNAGMVCRRWRHCASHSHTWKHVNATDYISSAIEEQKSPEVTSKSLKKHLDRYASQIRTLHISHIEHKLLSDVALPSLTFLEELHLSGYADLTDTHVHAMLLSCKINHGSKKNAPIPLKVLKLEQCPLLSNNTIKSISLFCHRLQELSVRGCRNISCLQSLQHLFQKKRTEINQDKVLSFDQFFTPPTTAKTFSKPSSNNGLESLFSGPPSNVQLTLLSPLPLTTNRSYETGYLNRVDVSHTRVTAQGLLEAFQVASKNTLLRMEVVRMSGSGETWTDSILENVCRSIDLTALETLDIGCSNVFKGSRQLTNVGLKKSLLMTTKSSTRIALQNLTLSGHTSISASVIADVLTNAPNLVELDIGGCKLANTELADFESFTTALLHFGDPVQNDKPRSRGLRRLSLWRCFSNRKEVLRKAQYTEEEISIEEDKCRTLIETLCCSPSSKTLFELDLDECYLFNTDDNDQLLKYCALLRNPRGLSIRGTKISDSLRNHKRVGG